MSSFPRLSLGGLPGSGVSTNQAGIDHQAKACIDDNQTGGAQPEPGLIRALVDDGLAEETKAGGEKEHPCLRLQVPGELGIHGAGAVAPSVRTAR